MPPRWFERCHQITWSAFHLVVIAGLPIMVIQNPHQTESLAGIAGLGLLFGLVLWFPGEYFAARIWVSPHAQFWLFTPLTPELYYQKNVQRSGIFLVTALLLSPLISASIGIVLLLQRPGVDPCVAIHLIANMTLLYYLLFSISLCELVTDRRSITGCFMVLTTPFRPFFFRNGFIKVYIVICVLSLAFVCTALIDEFVYPVGKVITSTFESCIASLVYGGLFANVAIFLISPTSGLFLGLHAGASPWFPWACTAIMVGLLVFCLRRIRIAYRSVPERLVTDLLDSWNEPDERDETGLNRPGEHLPIESAKVDAAGSTETPHTVLPVGQYDENATTEQIVLRMMLKEVDTTFDGRIRRMLTDRWLLLIPFGWLLCIVMPKWGDVFTLCLYHFWLWLRFMSVAPLSEALSFATPMPLRWPGMLWALLLELLRRQLFLDLLVVSLAGWSLELGWTSSLCLVVVLVIVRIWPLLCVWLFSVDSKARIWMHSFHALTFIGTYALVVCSGYANSVSILRDSGIVWFAPWVWFAIGCGLLLQVCLSLFVVSRRIDTSVLRFITWRNS